MNISNFSNYYDYLVNFEWMFISRYNNIIDSLLYTIL